MTSLKTSKFQSKLQQRFFFAKSKQPNSGITLEMAKEWAADTDFSKLPEKKKQDKKKKSASVYDEFLDAYNRFKNL